MTQRVAHYLSEDIHWGTHHEWKWEGHVCHWRRLGNPDNPPLVLIHGFASGSGHWRRNASVLAAAGWEVYGIDLVGFGASSQPGSLRLDNRFWARQLDAFLHKIVRRQSVLIGHSLGALVALSCSVYFPKLVKAVIAAPLPDPELLTGFTKEKKGNKRQARWRRLAKRYIVELLCRCLPLELIVPIIVNSPLLDLAIQSAYTKSIMGDKLLHRVISIPARRAGAVKALRGMSIGMGLRPKNASAPSLLERLSCPMLLIWGEKDLFVPLQICWHCQQIRKDIPATVIAESGHCPHDERAEIFNSVVLNWLMNH